MKPQPLKGKVAVVAGATRGAGRGIACALGEAGAIVYCTGRSVRGKPATQGRTETIEQTAEMVSARGGTGIWVRVDHPEPAQVKALFARVKKERKGLDILVNDVWGGDELTEFLASESPLFVGRGVAALAADPKLKRKSGRVFASWDLSDEYGFADADGSRPHWGRHFSKKYGAYKKFDDTLFRYFRESPMAVGFPDWP